MTGRPRKLPAVPNGPREERYLHCTECEMSIVLNLGPNEDRPQHRCSVMYKAMPFDIDLPGSRAPKKKPIKWYEEKAKSPRPPAPDRRPQIVL
jgi:hypothetical protein